MKKTKILLSLLSAVIGFTAVIPCFAVYTESCAVSSSINVAEHTPQEIKQYIDAHQFDTYKPDQYKVNPSTSYPYSAGSLDDTTLQNSLNALNCMRYIAGLPEVSLNSEYSNIVQHASLVNCVNDVLTHYPEQPSDMPDDIYQIGAEGARSSNIANVPSEYYPKNTAYTVMLYMDDSDSNNIDRVGHRRWCLNPNMKETGFGGVGDYYAMYAHDMNRTDATEKGVCWPAQTMPIEYFDSDIAWSISMDENLSGYDIEVNITRKSDSAEWNFNSNSADGDFYVENNNYGQKGCIIFRPSGISINSDDVYDVRIEGMEEPVEYTVKFFSLSEITSEPDDFSLGDVNNDGLADASDASLILTEYSNFSTNQDSIFNDVQKKSADVNSDGIIDSVDSSKILEFYSYVSTSNNNISIEEWLSM